AAICGVEEVTVAPNLQLCHARVTVDLGPYPQRSCRQAQGVVEWMQVSAPFVEHCAAIGAGAKKRGGFLPRQHAQGGPASLPLLYPGADSCFGAIGMDGLYPALLRSRALDAEALDQIEGQLRRSAREGDHAPPISLPNFASIASGSSLRPGLTCPPLRPDAPQPGDSASRSVTPIPCSAR